ncbi:MAG: LacI family transcriptional regulator [Oscillibacter sp.]|jgi:LacI family transcriptional regulator|nr:LacI family transcriptional regulator [Oscillibacter sp.]
MWRVTIRDIAAETQLSTTAVSLVLNDQPNSIPEPTRRRIRETARRLDYVPNQVARALVTQEINAIGLLLPNISNVFFACLAKSVEQEARHYGYQTLLCDLDGSPENQRSCLQMLCQSNVKSVILASAQSQSQCEALFSAIESYGLTAVFADQQIDDLRFDSVSVDNRAGARLAVEHLLGLGHRRIGYILGPRDYADSRQRLEGVLDACRAYGTVPDEALMAGGGYSFEGGVAAGETLIARGATAIFAFNDMMAYGVWEAAKTAGRRIPEELSVVGFDDLFFSRCMPEPLTTVYQPVEEIGRRAVQVMMSTLRGQRPVHEQIILEPKLIVRSSTAAYRAPEPSGAAPAGRN